MMRYSKEVFSELFIQGMEEKRNLNQGLSDFISMSVKTNGEYIFKEAGNQSFVLSPAMFDDLRALREKFNLEFNIYNFQYFLSDLMTEYVSKWAIERDVSCKLYVATYGMCFPTNFKLCAEYEGEEILLMIFEPFKRYYGVSGKVLNVDEVSLKWNSTIDEHIVHANEAWSSLQEVEFKINELKNRKYTMIDMLAYLFNVERKIDKLLVEYEETESMFRKDYDFHVKMAAQREVELKNNLDGFAVKYELHQLVKQMFEELGYSLELNDYVLLS